jgi:hypothetical protein
MGNVRALGALARSCAPRRLRGHTIDAAGSQTDPSVAAARTNPAAGPGLECDGRTNPSAGPDLDCGGANEPRCGPGLDCGRPNEPERRIRLGARRPDEPERRIRLGVRRPDEPERRTRPALRRRERTLVPDRASIAAVRTNPGAGPGLECDGRRNPSAATERGAGDRRRPSLLLVEQPAGGDGALPNRWPAHRPLSPRSAEPPPPAGFAAGRIPRVPWTDRTEG